MTVHPNARRFHDFSPLGACHRLKRAPERRAPPSFDFEESHQMTTPSHQVQLDPANPKAMRDDFPASAFEKPYRLFFTGEPPLMPRIAPT
jgi:hypothetical protein